MGAGGSKEGGSCPPCPPCKQSNSGSSNSGASNSGSRNSEASNSGASNSGSRNSGSRNSALSNSRSSNTAARNSGASNSGSNGGTGPVATPRVPEDSTQTAQAPAKSETKANTPVAQAPANETKPNGSPKTAANIAKESLENKKKLNAVEDERRKYEKDRREGTDEYKAQQARDKHENDLLDIEFASKQQSYKSNALAAQVRRQVNLHEQNLRNEKSWFKPEVTPEAIERRKVREKFMKENPEDSVTEYIQTKQKPGLLGKAAEATKGFFGKAAAATKDFFGRKKNIQRLTAAPAAGGYRRTRRRRSSKSRRSQKNRR